MQSCFTRFVPTAVALATLMAGGCMTSKPPPPASKSAFFTSCSDLNALVSRATSGNDCALADQAPWGSSGQGARLHHVSGLACNIRCNPEASGKLLQSLRAEVERLAKQAGAEIIDSSEGKGDDGHLAGFEINYGIGNAHGKFEANRKPASAKPNKPDEKGYELTVKIEEWAG
jgi:hypothetical protein